MELAVTRNWWALVLRGILAIIFGILIIVWPGLALASLIAIFGAYMFVDGLFAIVGALSHRTEYAHWGLTLVEGIIGVLAGIATFVYPGLTAFTLLYIIAFWAIFTGAMEIIAAWRLREHVQGEWMLALAGVLSLLFGIFVLFFPGTGALAILNIIAAYAIIFGVILVGLGLRLRTWSGTGTHTSAPTHA